MSNTPICDEFAAKHLVANEDRYYAALGLAVELEEKLQVAEAYNNRRNSEVNALQLDRNDWKRRCEANEAELGAQGERLRKAEAELKAANERAEKAEADKVVFDCSIRESQTLAYLHDQYTHARAMAVELANFTHAGDMLTLAQHYARAIFAIQQSDRLASLQAELRLTSMAKAALDRRATELTNLIARKRRYLAVMSPSEVGKPLVQDAMLEEVRRALSLFTGEQTAQQVLEKAVSHGQSQEGGEKS